MSYELLEVKTREPKTQTKPGQLRRSGFIPGVIFSRGKASVSIKVAEMDAVRCLSKHSHVLELRLDGKDKRLVNLEEIQRDPLSFKLVHLSFHEIEKGKATFVTLPIKFIGKAPGVKEGGVVTHPMQEVEVSGLPEDIVEHIEVDISNLGLGESLLLSEVKPPKGLRFNEEDLEKPVAQCMIPRAEKAAEPAVAPAEVEVINSKKEDAAGEGAAAGASAGKKEE